MSQHHGRMSIGLMFVIGLAGCATVSQEAGFGDVGRLVNERTGHRVYWNQGTPEDEQVRKAVQEMLRHELTVNATVQIALLNNRRLQSTFGELGIAQAAVVQAGLLKNPIFDAAIHFPESGGRAELDFALAQEFLDVFFIPLRKSIAEAQFEATKLRVAGAVMDLAAHTRAAFYGATAAEQLLEMRQQVAAATAASLEVAKRLHDAGNIREIQLHQEQALHDQAKLDLSIAEGSIVETRERLNKLMGVWGADTRWTIGHRLPAVPEQMPEIDGLEAKAIAASIDLRVAQQDITAFGRRLGLAKATALVPEFELGIGAEREDEWEIGPHFSVPIPIFDQGQARLARVRAELRSLQETYIATAVDVRSAVRAARYRLLIAHRAVHFYQSQVLPLRAKIVRETLLEYNAMQVGVFQLLLAKQQQIETGRRYIEALRAYSLARAELDQLLAGRMTDLGAVNDLTGMMTNCGDTSSKNGDR